MVWYVCAGGGPAQAAASIRTPNPITAVATVRLTIMISVLLRRCRGPRRSLRRRWDRQNLVVGVAELLVARRHQLVADLVDRHAEGRAADGRDDAPLTDLVGRRAGRQAQLTHGQQIGG